MERSLTQAASRAAGRAENRFPTEKIFGCISLGRGISQTAKIIRAKIQLPHGCGPSEAQKPFFLGEEVGAKRKGSRITNCPEDQAQDF